MAIHDHSSVLQKYRNWQQTKQIACLFARVMAKEPARYGIKDHVIVSAVTQLSMNAVVDEFSRHCDAAKDHPACEGMSLILPDVTEVEILIAFLLQLKQRAGWIVEETREYAADSQRIYISVKYYLGDDGGSPVYSEVLGLGPFEFLPPTRRAPFTAFELRTKVPGCLAPKPPSDYRRAHLAAVPMSLLPKTAFDRLWEITRKNRLDVLGYDDPGAKAKVTFAIPRNILPSFSG